MSTKKNAPDPAPDIMFNTPTESEGSSSSPASQREGGPPSPHSPQPQAPPPSDPFLNLPMDVLAPKRLTPEEFPVGKLEKLEDMINRSRWVVPVLPEGELEALLLAAIDLAEQGLDTHCAPCGRFYREGLTTSFQKILTDDAVSGWKYEIHKCILSNSEKLVELCVLKLEDDNFQLLDLLALVLNPACKFHVFNSSRNSRFKEHGPNDDLPRFTNPVPRSSRPNSRGWLVDLIERFGAFGGFERLRARFQDTRRPLSVPLVFALIKPFSQCVELLSPVCIETYFTPIVYCVVGFLEGLSDEDLKRETKTPSVSDGYVGTGVGRTPDLSSIVKRLKIFLLGGAAFQHAAAGSEIIDTSPSATGFQPTTTSPIAPLAPQLNEKEELLRRLETLRLSILLRLLQVSSFHGKMNALNEVNQVITNVSYYSHRTYPATISAASSFMHGEDEEDWLTADRMINWIKENRVLQIVLKDTLHQPQYVEKLERIFRFIIKEKALTMEDLDTVWNVQVGKHEAIVKNIHDLLAKLAWDFSPEQLDHLFQCFQRSFTAATPKEREKLLELIRRLAEDDKEGIMANKVLQLFWNISHSREVPAELVQQALKAHVKVLDFSCSQDRDALKYQWLQKCIEELNSEQWVLPALKQMMDICTLYSDGSQGVTHAHGQNPPPKIHDLISGLHNEHNLVTRVTNNLCQYMEKAKEFFRANPQVHPSQYVPDGRHNHEAQINERLKFLSFLLKDGRLWLCQEEATRIWKALTVDSLAEDRELAFNWYCKLMTDEPDLDPEICREFFEENILKLDPHLLTESGIRCYERFFHHVNIKERKMIAKRRSSAFLMEDYHLIGIEYLWRVILSGSEQMAFAAAELLIQTYTNLGPKLKNDVGLIHEDFVQECFDKLKCFYDALTVLSENSDVNFPGHSREIGRVIRVLGVLNGYFSRWDELFLGERQFPPLCRAFRGRSLSLTIRLQAAGRQGAVEDIGVVAHSNQTLGTLRREILNLLCPSSPHHMRLELTLSGDVLEPVWDKRLITEIPLKDKMILMGKLVPAVTHPTSPDSSSESSAGSPPLSQPPLPSPSTLPPASNKGMQQAEQTLPSVMFSLRGCSIPFLLKLADQGIRLGSPELTSSVWNILRLMPVDHKTEQLLLCSLERAATSSAGREEAAQPPSLPPSLPLSQGAACLPGMAQRTSLLGTPGSSLASPQEAGADLTGSGRDALPASPKEALRSLFVGESPSVVLYHLEVLHVLMMPWNLRLPTVPAAISPASSGHAGFRISLETQATLIEAGGLDLLITLLTSPAFIQQGDSTTRRSALWLVIRLVKLVLTITAHAQLALLKEAGLGGEPRVQQLERSLPVIPSPSSEFAMRQIARELSHTLGPLRRCLEALPPWLPPAHALIGLAWSCSVSRSNVFFDRSPSAPDVFEGAWDLKIFHSLLHPLRGTSPTEPLDLELCKEALECLTVLIALQPQLVVDIMQQERRPFTDFMMELLLWSPCRGIRAYMGEELHQIAERAASSAPFSLFVLDILMDTVPLFDADLRELAPQSQEFFKTLEKFLVLAAQHKLPYPTWERKLWDELMWLEKVRKNTKANDSAGVHEALLEGHLMVTTALTSPLVPAKKIEIGADAHKEFMLVKRLVEDFLFPASFYVRSGLLTAKDAPPCPSPVAASPATTAAAFDLLIALVTGCTENFKVLSTLLIHIFHETDSTETLADWEYLPPIGPRNNSGFVGLKNAGATCYMNSILQQLYMIPPIRKGVLEAYEAWSNGETDEDLDALSDSDDSATKATLDSAATALGGGPSQAPRLTEEQRYNVRILKQIQAIFGHLAASKLQFYVPQGLWKHFRINNEPVNPREQHDALEFFTSLVDSINEALKTLGRAQVMSDILGGSFSDQKICKGCPHRYSLEAPFTVWSIDIRNHCNLINSLEEFVKGDLLEGDNAYDCDKCQQKRDIVKRMCLKRLPPVLPIQLKRFDYDIERDSTIKFNDYFEFPTELDVEPYTVGGLARAEGEWMEAEDTAYVPPCTKYKLTGIVVHSGQASGGHYYSYILSRQSDGTTKWLKFDDADVTECQMDREEEMKQQCFGGEYVGEVYDHMSKRMNSRRQKRWWNAYILFYARMDEIEAARLTEPFDAMAIASNRIPPMPVPVMRNVMQENGRLMHTRSQYSQPYFTFMKKLLLCNAPPLQPALRMTRDMEEVTFLTLGLASKFLFQTAFRTKKTLRGPFQEWGDALLHHLRASTRIRSWFVDAVLLSSQYRHRICEYLLECPVMDIRAGFAKFLAQLCHLCVDDPPSRTPTAPGTTDAPAERTEPPQETLSLKILTAVLELLKKEVSDFGRNLLQYFSFFAMFASKGDKEKLQLMTLRVPALFIMVATEDGPGPAIKYQYPELNKLHHVVSMLVRCYEPLHVQVPRTDRQEYPNRYIERSIGQPLLQMDEELCTVLLRRPTYLKKILEEHTSSEDTIALVSYLCWESRPVSCFVLNEIQAQVTSVYNYEIKCWLELLVALLSIEDSILDFRISDALRGDNREKEGLFDFVQRCKSHNQKKAYQCIKALVHLFNRCPSAHRKVMENRDLAQQNREAICWLQEELEQRRERPGPTSPYQYNWSPPVGASNESASNGYFLERSPSAVQTLKKAMELCPLTEEDEDEESVGGSPRNGSPGPAGQDTSMGGGAEGGVSQPREAPPKRTGEGTGVNKSI